MIRKKTLRSMGLRVFLCDKKEELPIVMQRQWEYNVTNKKRKWLQ